MPTITIPEPLFDRLTRRAAVLGVTADALAATELDRAVPITQPSADTAARLEALRKLTELFQSLSSTFPPGHVTDVSREAMYEDRLRSQL